MNKLSHKFRSALLSYVERRDKDQQLAIELDAMQKKYQQHQNNTCKICSTVIAMWKKEIQPAGPTCDFIKLPDGRIASLQDGSITIWPLTELP